MKCSFVLPGYAGKFLQPDYLYSTRCPGSRLRLDPSLTGVCRCNPTIWLPNFNLTVLYASLKTQLRMRGGAVNYVTIANGKTGAMPWTLDDVKQVEYCAPCGVDISRTNMIETARRGRAAFINSEKSRARLAASQKIQNAARCGWLPSNLPAWLTQSAYREMILPRVAQITVPTLARTMSVTEPYAAEARKGRHIPHPMHWQPLSKLVGVSGQS